MSAQQTNQIGDVEPINGFWHWPFSKMQLGDYFYVAHEWRETERVRNLAYVTGARLGVAFSVEANPVERPGYTKVTRVEPGSTGRGRPSAAQLQLQYGTLRDRINDVYGYDLDRFDWFMGFELGQPVRIEVPQLNLPPRNTLVMKLDGYEGEIHFLLQLDEEGFTIVRYPSSGDALKAAEMFG